MTAPGPVPARDHSSDRAPAVALRETCRLVSGRVPLWPYHRSRLASGGCGEAVLRAADAALEREAEGWAGPDSSRLRLTLVVTPDGRIDARVQRRLSSLDIPGGPLAVVVEADGVPVLPRGGAKPADRTWWDDAQRRARAFGADQAIITAPDGRVIDGGTASVWAVFGGVLVTPPAPDAVAGVARAFLLDACARAGVPARVADLDLASLDAADELFLTNAFAGAVAVRGRGGRVFAAVAEEFGELWGA
jgi:branched-subunit amino acid aminotransferase/4-amino-4-deoxychorismate lyase